MDRRQAQRAAQTLRGIGYEVTSDVLGGWKPGENKSLIWGVRHIGDPAVYYELCLMPQQWREKLEDGHNSTQTYGSR